ncbi:hypothetical protein [Actinomadura meridiana]
MSIGAYLDSSGSWFGLLTDQNGPEVELSDVTSVWQRRPSQLVMDG